MANYRYPMPMSTDVAQFSKTHNLPAAVPLNFSPVDPRYLTDYCHINAKDMATRTGGKRVHGWALWEYYGPRYPKSVIVGNFHSVWEDEHGNLVDVTPPKIGTKTLFVRDDSLSITRLKDAHSMPHNRTHHPEDPYIHPVTGASESSNKPFVCPDDPATTAYCKNLGWPGTSWD